MPELPSPRRMRTGSTRQLPRPGLERLPSTWLLLGLCLLGACSESVPARGLGRRESPTFQRVESAGALKAQVVQTLIVPDAIEPWVVEGSEASVHVGVDGTNSLQLLGPADRIIRIPCQLDPQAFNQILVHGVFPGVVGIRVVLVGPDEQKHPSDTLASNNSSSPQHILFDLPRLRLKRKPYEQLELRIVGKQTRMIELTSIELISVPLAQGLPDPAGAAQLVMVDHLARKGFGLTNRERLRCEFQVEDALDTLSFAHGQPAQMSLKQSEPELHLRLFEGGAPVFEQSYSVESESWKEVSIELEKWVGKRLACELSLSGDSKGEEIVAVANFTIGRRAERPPTVLLVSSDTHRADHVGYAGDLVRTPNLDQLGARGVIFSDAYASTNITSPSHVSMMTGMHPRDHRVVSNTGHMVADAPTLARAFSEAGFACIGLVSVRHLGPQGTGLGQGFDRMKAPIRSTWTADRVVDEAIEMMKEFEGQPLFVWVHLFEAHHPYAPPEDFDRRYYPRDKDPFDKALPELVIAPGAIPKDMLGIRDLDFPKAQYRAEIDFLDRELGRLLNQPRVLSGITAVTADHGEILDREGTYFNHTEIYPEALHVPLILAWPDAPAGTRVDQPVRMLDTGRTLLDLSGHGGEPFPGRNLLGVLDGENKSGSARFALSAHGASASITKDNWHLMLHLREHKGALPTERHRNEVELFDMSTDPDCLHDRHADPTAKAKGRELCKLLTAWLVQQDGRSLSTSGNESAEDVDALRGLGYTPEAADVEDEPWYVPDPDHPSCGCFD